MFGQEISNSAFSGIGSIARLGRRRRWRRPVAALVRQEGERHAEDVDVLGLEEAGLGIHLVGRAAQAPPDHLLAQELAGEGPQAHDVRHGLGVPAFGEHPDRDHVLDLLARLAGLPTVSTVRRSSSACSSLVS